MSYLNVLFYSEIFKSYVIYLFILIVTLLATLLSAYGSLDSDAYHYFFNHYSESGWEHLGQELYAGEFFFLVLAKLLQGFPSVVWFAVIAFCSVTLKLLLIQRGSRHFYLSLFFYLIYFFVLQDGTGVRVSLAIALAYWAAYQLSVGRITLSVFLLFSSLLLFHNSLVFFLCVYFFRSKKITYILAAIWPIQILLWWLGGDALSIIRYIILVTDTDFPGLYKLKIYVFHFDENSAPYSLQFIILYIASILVFLRFKDKLTCFELICFNCVFFSLVILAFFVGAGGLQNRVSEIFRFGLIFIFPLYYSYLRIWICSVWLTNIFTGIILAGYFYYYIIISGLIVLPESWNVF